MYCKTSIISSALLALVRGIHWWPVDSPQPPVDSPYQGRSNGNAERVSTSWCQTLPVIPWRHVHYILYDITVIMSLMPRLSHFNRHCVISSHLLTELCGRNVKLDFHFPSALKWHMWLKWKTRLCLFTDHSFNSLCPGGIAKMGHFFTPYWRHPSLGYLKKIWMPVVNINWCPWTLKGFNIKLLMSIIECWMLRVKYLTLLKPKKWKRVGIFTRIAKINRAVLDFYFAT